MNIDTISLPPKVTIVTPSYNQGIFIEQTILSVLNQAYSHIEYIVVDACSTDDTHAILEKYKHRITRVIIEPDEGQSDAINKGFRLASGDLVGWLNSDDMLQPHAVESIVSRFFIYPEAYIFYGNVDVVDETGNYLSTLEPPQRMTYQTLLNNRVKMVQPGSFYSAEGIRSVGGVRAEISFVMDRDLWLRLLQKGDGFHTGDSVALFRQHGESKTSTLFNVYCRESFALDREFSPNLLSWRTLRMCVLRLQYLKRRLANSFASPDIR